MNRCLHHILMRICRGMGGERCACLDQSQNPRHGVLDDSSGALGLQQLLLCAWCRLTAALSSMMHVRTQPLVGRDEQGRRQSHARGAMIGRSLRP